MSKTSNQLRVWSDFLDVQMAHFEHGIIGETGHSHVADEVNTAFLKTDDDFARADIEAAVASFIQDHSWPPLRAREYRHLQLRAYCARGAILAVLSGQAPIAQMIKKRMPDLDDRERTIRWLFVESWNLGGSAFIEGMTDAFLKNLFGDAGRRR